jgi:hypothetical protein
MGQNSDEFGWTRGNDPTIFHRRMIDVGGCGEVHEVYLDRFWLMNTDGGLENGRGKSITEFN